MGISAIKASSSCSQASLILTLSRPLTLALFPQRPSSTPPSFHRVTLISFFSLQLLKRKKLVAIRKHQLSFPKRNHKTRQDASFLSVFLLFTPMFNFLAPVSQHRFTVIQICFLLPCLYLFIYFSLDRKNEKKNQYCGLWGMMSL